MASPRFSVITVVYNGAKVLPRTLDSVTAQDHDDFEYIIVDGGSTDGTVELIAAEGSPITRWVSERDRGIYDAMNKAARLAVGDYLYFLNAGDTFKNSAVLSEVAKFLTSDSTVLVGRVAVSGGRAALYPVDFSLDGLKDLRSLFASHFCHQAIFVSRRDWLASGGFSLAYPHFADFHNAVRLMQSGHVVDAPGLVVADFPLDGASSDWRKAVQLYEEKELILNEFNAAFSKSRYLIGKLRAHAFYWRALISRWLA